MTDYTYTRIDADNAPSLIWGTPRHMQGQICEVEYGTRARDGFGDGDPYKRTRDRSVTTEWTYYKRAGRR